MKKKKKKNGNLAVLVKLLKYSPYEASNFKITTELPTVENVGNVLYSDIAVV